MRVPTLSTAAGLLAMAGILALGGCASGPEIRHDTNPSASFATYRTFAFYPELATDRAGYESVFTTRLKESTRRQMEAKGYTFSEADPDLLLNFYANVEDKQEIRSTPVSMGYYGYRGYYGYGMHTPQVETVNYKEGTLTIDLVDPKSKILVWNSTAEGRVSKEARKNPGPAIDELVTQMLASLPARSGM